jgi:pimeloyl-ACP methyl ester carboxylesterase
VTTGIINTNGVRLHYERTGGGGPPVLLVHGLTDSGRCWPLLAPVLAREYDVVTVDLRGHGLSDKPAAGYTRDDHAADLAGLIEELGLGRPRLVGHSMGADVVAGLAAAYPHLARCAVLEDPPWRTAAAAREASDDSASWRRDLVADQASSRRQLVAAGRAEHPNWPEEMWAPWAEARLQVSLDAFDGYVEELPRQTWREILARIACPTLLLTGDPQLGGLVTPDVALGVERALGRHGWHVHVEGVGHCIRREAFERYAEAVVSFLGEH